MRHTSIAVGRRAGWLALIFATLFVTGTLAQTAPPEPAQIRSLLEAKRFSEAEAALGRAIAAKGETDQLLALRAELYRRTDRLDQAHADYKRVAAARPNDTDALFWIATIDRWRGRREESIAGFGKLLAVSKCNHGALTGRARAHQSADNLAAAEADLRTALSCRPADEEASELLAAILAKTGRNDEAVSLLRDAFSGADLEVRLGDLEMSRRNAARAREHYRTALAAAPENAKVIEKLADAERTLGNTAQALALYEKAASLSPDGGPLYWVGLLSIRTGNLGRAEKAFDAILEKRPEDSGALIGMARVRRSQGRTLEALELVDRVLARRPDNGEALVLRGSLYQTLGRKQEARRDFQAALAKSPDDGDALLLLDRVGPSRSFTLAARSSSSKVIEGLEDAGIIVDGVPIRPTGIEYINEDIDLTIGADVNARTTFAGLVSRGRDAVRNRDRGTKIYDFDVTTAAAGFDHRVNRWNVSWRLGGTRFEPRETGTIETKTKPRGSIAFSYDTGATLFVLGYNRRPYTHRGFAEDTKFRIFEEDRLTLSWERSLRPGLSVRLSSGASAYDGNSDDPLNASLGLRWDRRGNAFFVRIGHEPVAARVLGPDLHLQFIDFDVVSTGGHSDLGAGFRVAGDVAWGRYGKTQRDDTIGGIRVEGPFDNNTERRTHAELRWTAPRFQPLKIGAEYDDAEFDFRTGPYNTRDRDQRSVYLELSSNSAQRARYQFRAAYERIKDLRSPDAYDEPSFLGNLQVRLGGPGSAYWLGIEGLYRENDLDEERNYVRVFLTVPF